MPCSQGNKPYNNCFLLAIPRILTLSRCTSQAQFCTDGFGLISSGIALGNSYYRLINANIKHQNTIKGNTYNFSLPSIRSTKSFWSRCALHHRYKVSNQQKSSCCKAILQTCKRVLLSSTILFSTSLIANQGARVVSFQDKTPESALGYLKFDWPILKQKISCYHK